MSRRAIKLEKESINNNMRGGRGGRGRGFGRGGNSFIQNFLRDNGDDRNANDLEDAPPQLYNI